MLNVKTDKMPQRRIIPAQFLVKMAMQPIEIFLCCHDIIISIVINCTTEFY